MSDHGQTRSEAGGPPLASLSLSNVLVGAQVSTAGSRLKGVSRAPAPGGRRIPAPTTGQRPATAGANGAPLPSHAAVANLQTSGAQQQQQQQRRRRAWHLPLAAGLGLFHVARRAVTHVLTRGPAARSAQRPVGDQRVFPSLVPASAGPGHSGRPGMPAGRKPALVWFRNDLRLHDHEPLAAANGEGTSVVPVYCFDPREYGKSPSGFDKTGPYRARFILEALADLRGRLREAGSDLVVRLGKPEEVLPRLAATLGAGAVYCYGEVTREEQRVEGAVAAALDRCGARLVTSWGGTLYHRDDLPFQLKDLPPSYGEFRQRVNGLAVRAPATMPSSIKGFPAGSHLDAGQLPTLQQLGLSTASLQRSAADPAAAGAQLKGGETQALAHLRSFLSELQQGAAPQPAPTSSSTSSSSAGAGAKSVDARSSSFSCRISPWLALGCLSPREMYHQLLKQAGGAQQQGLKQGAGRPGDMSWLLFELMWRDFFRFITDKYAGVAQPASAHGKQQPAMQSAFAMA